MPHTTDSKKNANPNLPAPPKEPAPLPGQANEGEGSRTAARRYDEATAQYVESGHAEAAAKKAEKALDGAEGDALRAAEAFGKAGHPNKKPH